MQMRQMLLHETHQQHDDVVHQVVLLNETCAHRISPQISMFGSENIASR